MPIGITNFAEKQTLSYDIGRKTYGAKPRTPVLGILIADYRSFIDRQERFKEVMNSLGLMLEPVDGSIKERAIPPYICRLAGITSMKVAVKTIAINN